MDIEVNEYKIYIFVIIIFKLYYRVVLLFKNLFVKRIKKFFVILKSFFLIVVRIIDYKIKISNVC